MPIDSTDWLLNASSRFLTGSSAPAQKPSQKSVIILGSSSQPMKDKRKQVSKNDLAQAPLERVSTAQKRPGVVDLQNTPPVLQRLHLKP